jgi:hypothetical protein
MVGTAPDAFASGDFAHPTHSPQRMFRGFHSTVNNNTGSKRCHPNLFGKLAKLLRENGAPHPSAMEETDT